MFNHTPIVPIMVVAGSIIYLYINSINLSIICVIFILILTIISLLGNIYSIYRIKHILSCLYIPLVFFILSAISTMIHINKFEKYAITQKVKINIIAKVKKFELGQKYNYGILTDITIKSRNNKNINLQNIKIYTTKKIELTTGTTIRTIITVSPLSKNIIKDGYKYYLIDMLNNINGIGFMTWFKEVDNNIDKRKISIYDIINNFRNIVYNDYLTSFKDYEYVDILTALIIAKKNNLPNNVKEYFRNTSTSHIIVISGFHFTIMMMLLSIIIKFFFICVPNSFTKLNLKKTTYITTSIIGFFFLLLCGNSISTQRAFYMLIYHTIGVLLEKEVKLIYNLCITTTIMMLLQPSNIFDISFQLSSLSVLGICSAEELVRLLLKRVKYSKLHNIIRSFVYSIYIKILTTPAILFTFRNFVPMGMIANYIVTPLVSIILPINVFYFVSKNINLFSSQYIIYLESILITLSKILVMIVKFFNNIQMKPILIEQIKDIHIFLLTIFIYTLAIIPFYKSKLKYITLFILFIITVSYIILDSPRNDTIILNSKKNFMFVSRNEIYSYKIKKTFSKEEREWIDKQRYKNIDEIKQYTICQNKNIVKMKKHKKTVH